MLAVDNDLPIGRPVAGEQKLLVTLEQRFFFFVTTVDPLLIDAPDAIPIGNENHLVPIRRPDWIGIHPTIRGQARTRLAQQVELPDGRHLHLRIIAYTTFLVAVS